MNRSGFVSSTELHDKFFQDPSWRTWFRLHTPVVAGYTPSFDPVTLWHPKALVYWDVLAIYDAALVSVSNMAMGQWSLNSGTNDDQLILRDAAGNKLKLDYADADGKYREYAADISNPKYVARMLGAMRQALEHPGVDTNTTVKYAGLYLDDVDLAPKFVNEAGQPVQYDLTEWRQTMIKLVQAVRQEFPGAIIVHNPVWWETELDQIRAADYINIERGVGDPNLRPADFAKLVRLIETVHGIGRHVIQEEYFKANLGIALPWFDLVREAGDLLAVEDMLPDQWAI